MKRRLEHELSLLFANRQHDVVSGVMEELPRWVIVCECCDSVKASAMREMHRNTTRRDVLGILIAFCEFALTPLLVIIRSEDGGGCVCDAI